MPDAPYVNQSMAAPRQLNPPNMQSGCYGKRRITEGEADGKWGGIYAITDANVDLVSRELDGMAPWGVRNADGSYEYDDMTGLQMVAGQFIPGPFIKVTVTTGEVAMFDWGPQF